MELAPGEIYFIREHDVISNVETPYVKIGRVNEDPERSSAERALEHQTGNPRKLSIHHVLKTPLVSAVENKLHRFYAKSRVSGEWFNLTPELLESAIDKAKEFVALAEKDSGLFIAAEKLELVISTEKVLKPSDADKSWHQLLLEAKFKLKTCVSLEKTYKKLPQTSTVSIIQPKKPKPDFDYERFQEEYPEIWELFQLTEEKWSQAFRVTATKGFVCDLKVSDLNLFVFNEDFNFVLKQVESGTRQIEDLQELYFDLRTLTAAYSWDVEVAESQLKVAMGDAKEIEGICTWSRSLEKKTVFDKKNLEAKHPDLVKEFTSMKEQPDVKVADKY